MNFNLSYKSFILIKYFSWAIFLSYILFLLFLVNSIFFKISILFTIILFRLTVVSFLNSWFFNRTPHLIEWIKFSTFFTLVFNFLVNSSELDSSTVLKVGYFISVKSEYAFYSLIIIFLGILGLNFGSKIFEFKRKQVLDNYYFEIKNLNFLYFFSIILGFINLILVLNGVIGFGTYEEFTTSSYSFLISISQLLSPFFLSVFSIFYFLFNKRDRKFSIIFLLVFSINIFSGLLSGMKEEIFKSLLIIIIPFILSGRSFPKFYLIFIIIFSIFLYPLINNFRNIKLQNYNLSTIEVFLSSSQNTFSGSFVQTFSVGASNYSDRISLFPFLMYGVEHSSNWTAFKNMDRYIYLPFGWIVPRVLLPSKPIANHGREYSLMLGGNEKTSVTPSMFGWSYLEGGYLFVFITCFILGAFFSVLQYYLNLNHLYFLFIFLYQILKLRLIFFS